MVINYTVRANDSLRRIAATYGTTYETLVAYNDLVWPFLVNDPQPGTVAAAASGMVQLTFPAPVSAGFQISPAFTVAAALTGTAITQQYQPLAMVPVAAGTSSVTVPVACTVPGTFGNVAPLQITLILTPTEVPAGTTVTNPNAFVNGTNKVLLVPGDTLYIPTTDTLPSDIFAQPGTAIFGGTDLQFDFTTGDLVVGLNGDYALVSGTATVAQHLQGLMSTRQGDLVMHPDYGFPGMNQLLVNSPERDKQLALDTTEVLLTNTHVATVNNVTAQPSGTALYLVASVTLRNSQTVTVGSLLTGGSVVGTIV